MKSDLNVSVYFHGYPQDAVETLCGTLARGSAEWRAFWQIKSHYFKPIPRTEAAAEQANGRVHHTNVKGKIADHQLYRLFGALTMAGALVYQVNIDTDE